MERKFSIRRTTNQKFESIDLGCLVDYKSLEGDNLKGSVLVQCRVRYHAECA